VAVRYLLQLAIAEKGVDKVAARMLQIVLSHLMDAKPFDFTSLIRNATLRRKQTI
jgi:hypothetical protein